MLLFWLMLNCVCLRAGGRLASHWPATVKECDSIVYMLEQGSGCATARQSMLVRRLYGVSRKYPGNKAVRWRALYWDAVDKNDRMMPALADSLLGAAGRLVDSVAYEYDYRRIRRSAALVRLRSPGQMYNLYRAQLSDLEYFERISDHKTVASCHLVLGKVFLDIGEPLQALDESREARRLFLAAASPGRAASAEMNEALCLIKAGRSGEGHRLLLKLARSGKVAGDTLFHTLVLLNLGYAYGCIGEECPDVYMEALARLSSSVDIPHVRALAGINLGSWHYRRKRYREAAALFTSTLGYAEENGLVEWRAKCSLGLADCFMALHKPVEAASYYKRYAELTDSLSLDDMRAKILMAEEAGNIKAFNEAVEAEKVRAKISNMRIVAISAVVLLVLGAVCILYWYKHRIAVIRLMEKQVESERNRLELERQSRKLAASTIEMEDKVNALRAIRGMVAEAVDRHEIDSGLGSRIRAQLKAHLDADVGWGTFRQAFEQVYPSFFTRLKERHPVLTDYDVRLCAYIVAGADNKQISMLLNILPESLKKSRTRLRKKLGIGAGDSLADYLRGFNGA